MVPCPVFAPERVWCTGVGVGSGCGWKLLNELLFRAMPPRYELGETFCRATIAHMLARAVPSSSQQQRDRRTLPGALCKPQFDAVVYSTAYDANIDGVEYLMQQRGGGGGGGGVLRQTHRMRANDVKSHVICKHLRRRRRRCACDGEHVRRACFVSACVRACVKGLDSAA